MCGCTVHQIYARLRMTFVSVIDPSVWFLFDCCCCLSTLRDCDVHCNLRTRCFNIKRFMMISSEVVFLYSISDQLESPKESGFKDGDFMLIASYHSHHKAYALAIYPPTWPTVKVAIVWFQKALLGSNLETWSDKLHQVPSCAQRAGSW